MVTICNISLPVPPRSSPFSACSLPLHFHFRATSADRIAREQAQAPLFKANTRIAAAEARSAELEAQVQAPHS